MTAITADTSDTLRLRLRRDPAWFCRQVLGIKPWRKQIEVLRALRDNDRVAVRSGHGTGKSFIAAAGALWFLYSHYPAKVITTAPTWNQVKHILWKEIRRLHAGARCPLGGKVLEERIKLDDGSFAIGLSTDAPERLQGFHAEHVLVVLDEAPGVDEELWHAAETLLTGRVGKILAIGNPTRPRGLFYQAFQPGTSWKTVHISCLDSPNLRQPDADIPFPRLVTSRWIEARAREWGTDSPIWKSRVLGEFPDDDVSRLIPRRWLEQASLPVPCASASRLERAPSGLSAPTDDPEGDTLSCAGTLHLGVDVARHGTDKTVFLLRDDTGILFAEEQSGWSTMQTAGRVIALMEEYSLAAGDVFIDDTGLGAGVTDRLREQEYDVAAVIASGRADDAAHYANVRAEMFWRLRMRLSPDAPPFRIPPAYSELLRELEALSFDYTSAGQIKIADKVELRGRLSGSPNYADALALTFAQRVVTAPSVTIL